MKWYVLHLNPVPWKVGPVYAARSKITHKIGGGVGRDQEVRTYQDAVADELRRLYPEKIEGKVRLILLFWREISTYATDKAAKARNNEADGTNLYKSTEDALQGILFDNDKDNINGSWAIVDQGPGVTGRVIIGIEETSREQVIRDTIDLLPEDVYYLIWGTPHQKLAAELKQTNTSLVDDEPDEYADAPEVF